MQWNKVEDRLESSTWPLSPPAFVFDDRSIVNKDTKQDALSSTILARRFSKKKKKKYWNNFQILLNSYSPLIFALLVWARFQHSNVLSKFSSIHFKQLLE